MEWYKKSKIPTVWYISVCMTWNKRPVYYLSWPLSFAKITNKKTPSHPTIEISKKMMLNSYYFFYLTQMIHLQISSKIRFYIERTQT